MIKMTSNVRDSDRRAKDGYHQYLVQVDVEHKGAAATSASHDRGLDVVVHYWDGLVDTFELGRAGPHALMLHEYADVRDFYGAYHRARYVYRTRVKTGKCLDHLLNELSKSCLRRN